MTNYTFQSLFDFTRTTSGTFVGSNGLIQTTPASVNLLTFTQEFDNAAWAKTSMTVTANSTTAPDGTSTADTMTATAGTGVSVRVGQSGTTVNATVYTVSFYVRPGTHTFVQIHINAQAADWVNFTLTGSGSVQNNGAAVGAISFNSTTGYYRISATYTAGSTDRTPFFGIVPSGTATRNQTWNPTGTETVFVWGAQLQTGSTATTYTRNNGGRFPPRFDYDPATLQPKGILIEEQRVNLLLRSEQYDNATWQKSTGGVASAPSITADFGTSPDGTNNADRAQFALNGGTTSTDRSLLSQTVTIVNATSYTFSVWLRSLSGTVAMGIGCDGVAGNTPITVTSTWQRFTLTGTSTGTSGLAWLQLRGGQTPTQANAADVLVYGAQLEAGAFATSYIPTVASQVTRAADQCSIVAPMFAPWYNQSEGTFVAEAVTIKPPAVATANFVFIASDGTQNERVQSVFDTSNATAGVIDGNVSQANFTNAYTLNQTIKCAIAYKVNDFAASFNGSTATTDTSGTIPTVNRMSLGSSWDGLNFFLNGHIRSVQFYPFRASDTQLQALTT